ncbi:hypothetical protein SARC_09064 [Sphaeroforma arctica JP610]|uniref:Deacetylase sirtuin-type domain-containing protein n=1 Tax=Sphaeroforma arctica JP610 TaxID=667725 RepID=A0A0L0FPR8_9EUKA|nr:hypothetical protein SARC_09064 [Sphaeroforma arctica JP610]KNC78506.1 hypothetical protein SARC_09064 [Sphaeroforma arctica JP610]|eukprot:XP_014152408.1 hypothetical protein SARC_09064 [Sphaeroforma arctica JP610]
MENTPLLFVLGTSARVSPATDLPVIASNAGAKVVKINMEETQLTHTCVDYYLHAPLETVLPQIVECVRRIHRESKPRSSIVASLSKTFSRPSLLPDQL